MKKGKKRDNEEDDNQDVKRLKRGIQPNQKHKQQTNKQTNKHEGKIDQYLDLVLKAIGEIEKLKEEAPKIGLKPKDQDPSFVFVGREAQLKEGVDIIKRNFDYILNQVRVNGEIEKAILEYPVCAGLVGVGKTSLAKQIAKRYQETISSQASVTSFTFVFVFFLFLKKAESSLYFLLPFPLFFL